MFRRYRIWRTRRFVRRLPLDKVCPICHVRVSNSADARGLTVHINELVIHKNCMSDWFARHGTEWTIWEMAKQLSGG